MLRSYFKIAFRYLWRKKTYSILNFVCLTFGLTCAIITVLYIRNVFSYDKFHKNYNRLYAVDAYVTYFNGARFPKQYLSASLTDVLGEHAPEIEVPFWAFIAGPFITVVVALLTVSSQTWRVASRNPVKTLRYE